MSVQKAIQGSLDDITAHIKCVVIEAMEESLKPAIAEAINEATRDVIQVTISEAIDDAMQSMLKNAVPQAKMPRNHNSEARHKIDLNVAMASKSAGPVSPMQSEALQPIDAGLPHHGKAQKRPRPVIQLAASPGLDGALKKETVAPKNVADLTKIIALEINSPSQQDNVQTPGILPCLSSAPAQIPNLKVDFAAKTGRADTWTKKPFVLSTGEEVLMENYGWKEGEKGMAASCWNQTDGDRRTSEPSKKKGGKGMSASIWNRPSPDQRAGEMSEKALESRKGPKLGKSPQSPRDRSDAGQSYCTRYRVRSI